MMDRDQKDHSMIFAFRRQSSKSGCMGATCFELKQQKSVCQHLRPLLAYHRLSYTSGDEKWCPYISIKNRQEWLSSTKKAAPCCDKDAQQLHNIKSAIQERRSGGHHPVILPHDTPVLIRLTSQKLNWGLFHFRLIPSLPLFIEQSWRNLL